MDGRATGSAARREPARSCSMRCTTAGCCGWRGATAAPAVMRRAKSRRRPKTPNGRWMPWSTCSSPSTHRCPRLLWATRWAGLSTPCRSGRRCAEPRRAAPARAWRMPRSTASTGAGRPTRTRPHPATHRTMRCACSRPSTRWSGTGAASSCCGAGPTVSRPTHPRRSACAATTRCRCCGATGSSAGATWRSATGNSTRTSATWPAGRHATPAFAARWTTNSAACGQFLQPR